jgi:hypothetical protein
MPLELVIRPLAGPRFALARGTNCVPVSVPKRGVEHDSRVMQVGAIEWSEHRLGGAESADVDEGIKPTPVRWYLPLGQSGVYRECKGGLLGLCQRLKLVLA